MGENKNNLTISVALCTCNGEKYISEQIDSIIHQSLPVDEIVVCDDISDDDTVKILESHLSQTKIKNRIIINEKRLGPGLNFQKCFGLCNGDIVFLSDQDDIWKQNKVERFVESFSDENVVCAFSDAEIINSSGIIQSHSLLGKMIAENHYPTAFSHRYLADTMGRIQKTPNGCLMALRKAPFLQVFEDEMCKWHDAWFFHTAALFGEYAFLPEPLVSYRIHENNVTSSEKKQIAISKRLNSCDSFEKHFGLNPFRAARIEIFEKIITYAQKNNDYLKSYEKAIAVSRCLHDIKGKKSVSAMLELMKLVSKREYSFRYPDPYCPNGLKYKLRLLRVLFGDMLFLTGKH